MRGCGRRARPRTPRRHHHERRARLLPVVEQVVRALRLRRLEGRRVEHRERAALGVQRERAAQRGALLLAVDLEGVGARLGTEDDAAAGPDRGAVGAGAGATGALLAPRLGATAGDLCARLRGGGAASARGLLGAHALVHERPREGRAEGGLVELHLLRRRRRAQDGRLSHRCAPPRSSRAGPGPSPARAAGSPWRRRAPPRGPSASPAGCPSGRGRGSL